MLNRRTVLAGAAALVAAAVMPFEAIAATWVNLGSRTVNLLTDHDAISVGAGAGLYTSVRLYVTGNTVFIDSLKITFSNGSTYDVALRYLFLPASASRVIDLPGAARHIRRVDLVYRKLIGGGTAVVTLQGRKL
ncbi:MAG: hypothetical protein ABL866_13030 [Devosia sp.]